MTDKLVNWPMRIGIVIGVIVGSMLLYSIVEQVRGGAKIGLYPIDAGVNSR